MALIIGHAVIDALKAAGIADDNTRRVVLDIGVDGAVVAYVEKYVDERVIQVVEAMSSVEVRYAEAPEKSKAIPAR